MVRVPESTVFRSITTYHRGKRSKRIFYLTNKRKPDLTFIELGKVRVSTAAV